MAPALAVVAIQVARSESDPVVSNTTPPRMLRDQKSGSYLPATRLRFQLCGLTQPKSHQREHWVKLSGASSSNFLEHSE
jgi:hypothetical protein